MALQYKIPQNVDVEDKIFGPLSLRQFSWLVFGGFLAFMFYMLLAKVSFFLFILVDIPIVLFFAALAFYKINERPFELFIVSSLKTMLRPRRRIWMRTLEAHEVVAPPPSAESLKPASKAGLQEVRSQLEELTMIVDTRGWGKSSEDSFLSEGRIVSAPETGVQGWHDAEPEDVTDHSSETDLDKILVAAKAKAAKKVPADIHADASRRAFHPKGGI
jgi:hypothetical protein